MIFVSTNHVEPDVCRIGHKIYSPPDCPRCPSEVFRPLSVIPTVVLQRYKIKCKVPKKQPSATCENLLRNHNIIVKCF